MWGGCHGVWVTRGGWVRGWGGGGQLVVGWVGG